MTWNNRVIVSRVQELDHEIDWYAIHEVHYISNTAGEDYDNIRAWTLNPIEISGESVDDLRASLQMIEKALDKPVLHIETLQQQVAARPYWRSLTHQIRAFKNLGQGWDGYEAVAPLISAVDQAISFIATAESLADRCEATLNVNGSVIIEIDMGGDVIGELQFAGDGQIACACGDQLTETVKFDGSSMPHVIREVLERAAQTPTKNTSDGTAK